MAPPISRPDSRASRPEQCVTPTFHIVAKFAYSRFTSCANGQQLKCRTIIDEYIRKCLTLDGAGSIRSNWKIEILSRLVSERGAPHHLRSNNGPEFVSKALLRWVVNQELDVTRIDPGKPWQNGMVEIFYGKFRDECLFMEWFRSRTEAKVVVED